MGAYRSTSRTATLAALGLFGLLAACGSSETTTPDAGPADAGADAGPVDTGVEPVDAGPRDLGPEPDLGPSPLDESIAALLELQPVPVTPLDPLPAEDPAVVALGEALFYDPILSGNKDVACASCHQAESASADGLPLTLGTGATGRGAARAEGQRPDWGRRHTPDLWGRGRLDALFWDGRVTSTASIAGRPIPEGLTDPLAIQALHPLLDPTEMLGVPGDMAIDGTVNELAGQPGEMVYAGLLARLGAIEGYAPLFEAAFPGQPLSMQSVLTAIAAFERDRYDPVDTPWDRYLAGDLGALTDAAKLGAQVFYGAAACGDCHQGPRLTDEEFHSIGVPLLDPVDEGRALVDGAAAAFSFRTPPLRNVAATPPYMHNGTFATLQDVLRHYSNPEVSASDIDGEDLPADLAARIVTDPATLDRLQASLSDDLPLAGTGATPIGLSNIRQFLLHLVDDASITRAMTPPASVPSGLTVGGP